MADVVVDLWTWDLDAEFNPNTLDVLSADEQARADRFVQDKHTHRFVQGRGRLRQILADYLQIQPKAVHFEYGPQGKPFLREDLEFNLSHTENWAALAVSKDAPVGLDIQQYRYVEPEVAERFFSTAEVLELGSLSPSEWEDGFFRCWTRKEAIIKGIGRGLSIGLETFDVSLSPDKRAQIRRFSQSVNVVRDWSIHHLDFAENRVGALAVNSFQRSVSIIRK